MAGADTDLMVSNGVRAPRMASIRKRNTKPELLLRRALWTAGLRYRKHPVNVVGTPDVVFRARRIAVFIDGCFWHGCPEHYRRPPTSDGGYWPAKLLRNVERDRRQTSALRDDGW